MNLAANYGYRKASFLIVGNLFCKKPFPLRNILLFLFVFSPCLKTNNRLNRFDRKRRKAPVRTERAKTARRANTKEDKAAGKAERGAAASAARAGAACLS